MTPGEDPCLVKQRTPDHLVLQWVPSLRGQRMAWDSIILSQDRGKALQAWHPVWNLIPCIALVTTEIFTHRQTLRGGPDSSSFLLQPHRSTLREDAHLHPCRQRKGLNRRTLPNAKKLHLQHIRNIAHITKCRAEAAHGLTFNKMLDDNLNFKNGEKNLLCFCSVLPINYCQETFRMHRFAIH